MSAFIITARRYRPARRRPSGEQTDVADGRRAARTSPRRAEPGGPAVRSAAAAVGRPGGTYLRPGPAYRSPRRAAGDVEAVADPADATGPPRRRPHPAALRPGGDP